jgi:hypothetical protein
MCTETEAAAWKLNVPLGDKVVLIALAFHRNQETGQCNPGAPLLAKECGDIEVRSIYRIVNRLIALGVLAKECISGMRTSYTFPFMTQQSPVTAQSPVTNGSYTHDPTVIPPVTPGSQTRDPRVHITRKNQKENQKEQELATDAPSDATEPQTKPKAKRTRAADEPPPSNLDLSVWHRWEEYRKAIRKPIKPASVAAAQRKLAGFGPDQGAVVEQSIAAGYQGLFELRRRGGITARAERIDVSVENLERLERERCEREGIPYRPWSEIPV